MIDIHRHFDILEIDIRDYVDTPACFKKEQFMTARRIFLIASCMILIIGCAYLKSTRKTYSKSYALNVEEQASIGAPMITVEYNTYASAPHKYGLAEEQDHWQSFDYPFFNDTANTEIYTGISNSDNTIHISYKQYKKDIKSPTFSQELTYDLRDADIIVFKNYKIEILHTTSEYIRFRVLSD